MGSEFWNPDIKRDQIKQGFHVMPVVRKVDRDWKPEDKAAQRFLQQVAERVDETDNGVPAADSGYMYVSANETYDWNHGLNTIPSRLSLFLATKEDPQEGVDTITEITPRIISNVGFDIVYKNKNTIEITTGSSNVWGSLSNGYLRIMAWR